MKLQISLRGPRQTGPESGEVMIEACDLIPGETVEHLASRLFWRLVDDYHHPIKQRVGRTYPKKPELTYTAYSDVIEIRLVDEMPEEGA